MNKKLYVGNLPYGMTNEALQELFAAAGEVVSANVITDRDSGRSKGFGFVEMSTEEAAQKAIDALNGKDIEGRMLKVAEARPPQRDRDRGGDRGGRGGDRGGRGRRDDDW